MFIAQPQAGSGLRIAAQQVWAPGSASAISMALGIPPGSGATLSERDRRLAARHEERRRRISYGPQEGSADKGFQERQKERQAFEEAAATRNHPPHIGPPGPALGEKGNLGPFQTTLRAAIPTSADSGGDADQDLTSVLDKKSSEKSKREAIYEEKRRRYLAAKKASTSGKPVVSFQTPEKGTLEVSEHPPTDTATCFLGEIPIAKANQSEAYEQKEPLKVSIPPPEDQRMTATHESSERVSQARTQPRDQAQKRSPAEPSFPQRSPTATMKIPNTDYAKLLREQMVADREAARRAREAERRPTATLAIPPDDNTLPHAYEAVTEGPSASTHTTNDRKAEYARQLREQMAANEIKRHTLEKQRKDRAVPSSSNAFQRNGGEEVDNIGRGGSVAADRPVKDAKAEYAKQLREQMAAKENAQQVIQRQNGQSRCADTGPAWIESATEGREARRKRLNTEYAKQLRAQIAAHQALNMKIPTGEHRQQQPQWSGEVEMVKDWRERPERDRSRGDNQDNQWISRAEPGREEGVQTTARFDGGTNNPLAIEKQKRLDRQKEYAEALRRDMATPKVDSLGRPVEDITSPSKTRLRAVKDSHHNYDDNRNQPCGRVSGSSGPYKGAYFQEDLQPRTGGDTRGWSQLQEQQQQRPPLEREHLREHPPHNTNWPPSRDQRYQHPVLPESHYTVYGGNSKQHQANGEHHDSAHPLEKRGDARWVGNEGNTSTFPTRPQEDFMGGSRDHGWGDGRRWEEKGRWGTSVLDSQRRTFTNPGTSDQGRGTWQDSHNVANPSWSGVPGAGPRDREREQYPSFHHDGRRGGPGAHEDSRHGGPEVPPGGVPLTGFGVGSGMVSTKASTMHNPVDHDELARMQAKKEAYRRDLETQMAAHKKLVDQRKKGVPGSKEAEVLRLQEAMEERNERNKMASEYEVGPLGVAVMKDKYSTTGRGQRSPPKMRAPPPAPTARIPSGPSAIELLSSPGQRAGFTESDLNGNGGTGASSSWLPPSEVGASGVVTGEGVPPRRGSGLRDLLGTEKNADEDREKSRAQAEALKKQVEDNKARRDSKRAQLELEERREEEKLQKEREQLYERYEQESKLAKGLEAEKLLKEAEEARLAHAARKEKAAAEAREEEKREDERIAREQKELERKYAQERAIEEPLPQASSGPPKSLGPEFPVEKLAVANSPGSHGTPRETLLLEARPGPVEQTTATAAAVLTRNLRESSVNRDVPSLHSAPSRSHPTHSEQASVEKLRTELQKQKQVTEVLRQEVGQQESEKRKLLDIARCAKESEAAILRAAYERGTFQRMRNKDLGDAGNQAAANELWRVPPPPVISSEESKGGASIPEALRLAESGDVTKGHGGRHGDGHRFEIEGTVEDRLLLAGLRRLGDRDRTPREGRGPLTPTKGYLGGDSTFRERVPGARAWSRGVALSDGDAGDKGPPLHDGSNSPGGIRAESRYVFPDGSVRRGLETPGTARNTGVSMPLVGTSRINSADLSLAARVENDEGGANGGIESGGRHGTSEITMRRRRAQRSGIGDDSGGAYRGPGAAPGASWAPGGRPPRAYVPFLNLPASTSKSNGNGVRGRHVYGTGGSRGITNGSSDGDQQSPSRLPLVHSTFQDGRGRRRVRPLVGIGGVLVSPGRAMLTGPGRPGTGTCSSSGTMFGDTDSEYGHPRRSRRRRGGTGSRGRTYNYEKHDGDEDSSDGANSVGSGSTDVEFLRRRAEAKLRSLDRREVANRAAEADSPWSSSSAPYTLDPTSAAEAPTKQPLTAGGISAPAPIRKGPMRYHSTVSSSSSNRSFMYSSRKKRPGTNQSEKSMLGDSRWAVQ